MAELAGTLTAEEGDRLLQAEAVVRAYCGWHIAPSRTETVVFRCDGGRDIILPSLWVTAVTEVSVDAVQVDVTGLDFTRWGVLTQSSDWYGIVSVTFTHGYPEVPLDVTAAVQAIAQRSVAASGGRPVTSRTAGPYTEVYGGGTGLLLEPSDQSNLNAYRLQPIA